MPNEMHTRCCIAGGGSAGRMLGLLLARAGINVIVLEKHGDFLHDYAVTYPNFHLIQNIEVVSLLEDDNCVTGVHAETAEGILNVHADLVICADGRHSAVRQATGLTVRNLGVPIDVLWRACPCMTAIHPAPVYV